MNGEYDMPVNLGNPDEYSIKNFAIKIRDMTQSKSEIIFMPKVADDPSQREPDISTARRELGWEPKVSVEEGLLKTIAYFRGEVEAAGEIVPTGPDAVKPKGAS